MCKPLVGGDARAGPARPKRAGRSAHGRAAQAEPMKTMLKAPGTTRLDLAYDKLLSNFGFNFKLRRYTMVLAEDPQEAGRGLHSFTFQLNLSRV